MFLHQEKPADDSSLVEDKFLQICQLLFDVGSVEASEHLLRRNLDYYEADPAAVRRDWS